MNFGFITIMRFFGEFTGTVFYICLGCMGCISKNSLLSSLNFGLVAMIIMHCFGFISGGHANPVISISCCLLGYISPSIAVLYVFAQSCGALFGYWLLTLILTKDSIDNLCLTKPSSDLSTAQLFGIEFLLTSVMIFGWCALWDLRNSRFLDSVALRIGLLITACCLAGTELTGASMNPVRSIAPAFFNEDYDKIVIYLSSHIISAFFIPNIWAYLLTPHFKIILLSNLSDTET